MKTRYLMVLIALILFIPLILSAEEAGELLKMGMEAAKEGDHKSAVGYYDQALTSDPESAPAYAYRSMSLIHLGQIDEAIEDSVTALELNPGRTVRLLSLSSLGTAYIKKGDYEWALKALDELTTSDPKDPIPHFLKGEALRGLERYDEAIKSLSVAIELDPDYALAYYNRAGLKELLGDSEGATIDYDRACDIDGSLCR